MLLAVISSPTFSEVTLGPLRLRVYGLLLGVAIVVASWITDRRWVRAGGNPGVVGAVVIWVVVAGFIGARLYHVITDINRYWDNLIGIFKIWEGGLGIWGGVAVGVLVGVWRIRRMGESVPMMLWAVAPALPVAQAIGRLGNWFNQELYGRPTTLPWALEIEVAHRGHLSGDLATAGTYHPTFLYEMLWNLALAAVLVWVVPKLFSAFREPNGALFAVYVAGYTLGRLWIELIRIDTANKLLGLRINVWTSGVVFIGAVVTLVVLHRRARAGALGTDAAWPDEGGGREAAFSQGAAVGSAGGDATPDGPVVFYETEDGPIRGETGIEPADGGAVGDVSEVTGESGDSERA